MKKLITITFVLFCGACGPVDDVKETATETVNNKKEEIKDDVVCKGLIRDSILNRVDDAITDHISGDAPIGLTDLKEIGAAYAMTLDSTSLIAGNLLSIAAASDIACDEEVACADRVTSAERGSLSKSCDGEIETFSFDDDCQLYATPISGSVTKDENVWTFSQFQIVDERFLDGGVNVSSATTDRFVVDSVTDLGFELTRNKGKSCEDLIRFRGLEIDRTAGLTVGTDFDRETDSGTDYTVVADALRYPEDRSCTCPLSGSASIAFQALREKPVPLTLQMEFEETADCGEPTVSVPELTQFCEKYGCESDAVQQGLTAMLDGFCR